MIEGYKRRQTREGKIKPKNTNNTNEPRSDKYKSETQRRICNGDGMQERQAEHSPHHTKKRNAQNDKENKEDAKLIEEKNPQSVRNTTSVKK